MLERQFKLSGVMEYFLWVLIDVNISVVSIVNSSLVVIVSLFYRVHFLSFKRAGWYSV